MASCHSLNAVASKFSINQSKTLPYIIVDLLVDPSLSGGFFRTQITPPPLATYTALVYSQEVSTETCTVIRMGLVAVRLIAQINSATIYKVALYIYTVYMRTLHIINQCSHLKQDTY